MKRTCGTPPSPSQLMVPKLILFWVYQLPVVKDPPLPRSCGECFPVGKWTSQANSLCAHWDLPDGHGQGAKRASCQRKDNKKQRKTSSGRLGPAWLGAEKKVPVKSPPTWKPVPNTLLHSICIYNIYIYHICRRPCNISS